MVLGIEHLQCVDSDWHKLSVEQVGLQDLGIPLVPLVIGGGHVPDDVEDLSNSLHGSVELLISDHISLTLDVGPELMPHLVEHHIKTLELQTGSYVVYLDLKGHFDRFHGSIRLTIALAEEVGSLLALHRLSGLLVGLLLRFFMLKVSLVAKYGDHEGGNLEVVDIVPILSSHHVGLVQLSLRFRDESIVSIVEYVVQMLL